jgi:beta-lactamase superfamily II metal-dependent hydrolase
MRRFHVRWPGRTLRSLRLLIPAALVLLLVPTLALAAGNGKLQIHHINVGQGDGILLISPLGETALFDDGTYTDCSGIKNYLQGLGITSIKYHFCTHYHADHIGCIDDLAAIGITVTTAGYDRGGSYSSATYTAYVNTLGSKRVTITKNQTITLDAGAANPVYVKCVDLNGAGVYSGTDENALSVVYKVSYGSFDEVLGGDLSGASGSNVEAAVGPEVGDVEIYKVHHHGSATSTTAGWLNATTPEVGIISVGNGNSYGHPTSTALTNLHNKSVHTYWTETGAGVAPNPTWDKVGGNIVVQADPGTGASYTVAGSGFTDTYTNGGGGGGPLTDTKVASSVTMITGSVTGGSVANLAANDASRMTVTAAKPGSSYFTDWYGSATLAHPPTKLTITYDGNYSRSRTQTLYLYNFTTSSWTQVDQASVSTSDVTRTWTTTSPANYVSASSEVRLRVAANTRSSSYTCRADYMAFTYEYTQGTAVALVAYDNSARPAPSEDLTGSDELTLALAPNPALRSTRFSFTLSREADVRLEVFDLAGRRVATPFAGRATPGTTNVNWTLNRRDGSPLPAGIYFARLEGLGTATIARMVVLGR